MRQIWKSIRPYILFVPFCLIILTLVGGLSYVTGWLALLGGNSAVLDAPFPITPIAFIDGTPFARFGSIDPSIVEVLDYRPSNFGSGDLDILSIQPVGIYLPRSGDAQFVLAEPTPLPTPLPYPTSPPLPLPALVALPTLEGGFANRIEPYGGDTCAPAGRPVEGILTQRFHRYHSGIDIGISSGTPVIATHSGTVIFADWSEVGYGYLVIVQNGNYITYYAHNTSFNVVAGNQIGKGTILAWSGSTGNSTGPHVHYETRINDVPVDPLTFEAYGFPTC